MKRTLIAVLLVSLLVAGQSLSLSAVPKTTVSVGAQGQFTAAETLIAQTGTIGHWSFLQPPGFPPVTCVYVSGASTSCQINFRTPDIYPVDGFSSQKVDMGFRFYRRLPDGSRQITLDFPNGGAQQTTFSSPVVGKNFSNSLDIGSNVLVSVTVRWFDGTGTSVIGSVELLYNFYQTILAHYETINDLDVQTLPMTDACKPAFPAFAQLALSQGTVNQSIPFILEFFPKESPVTIYFDGNSIGSVMTDFNSHASGNLTVPVAPMGNHTVKFYRFGRTASATFTIKPRIKLIPSENIMRDQTVNVSLRGYKAREVVRIRWKRAARLQNSPGSRPAAPAAQTSMSKCRSLCPMVRPRFGAIP
jgi:hypothetical protein